MFPIVSQLIKATLVTVGITVYVFCIMCKQYGNLKRMELKECNIVYYNVVLNIN